MQYFILTDLHIGLPNVTEKIVDNLILFFLDKKNVMKKVDYIIINGDTFDRMLASNSIHYKLAFKFITFLVKYCKQYSISLRILEGTPSHDNKQMENISIAIEEFNDIDYKYVSTLSIEYCQMARKHYLYLPDKYRESGEEIQQAITDKLKEHNLDRVDMIFAHGNFNYQLPIKLKSGLDENFFLDICNYYIVIGHIHTRSIWQRIIAPGSFDRLEVNQEEDKGGVLITLGKTIDNSTFEFITNDNAMRHDTLDLKDLDIKEAYKKVVKYLNTNGYGQFDQLRVVASRDVFKELKDKLDNDGYLSRIKKFDDSKKESKLATNKEYTKVSTMMSITKDNIMPLLLERKNIKKLSKSDIELLSTLIKEISN